MFFESNQWYLITKTMLSTLMVLLMLSSLSDVKYSKKRTLIILSIYLLYVFTSSYILLQYISWTSFLKIFIFTITIPSVILIFFLAKGSVMQAIFNYMTQVNLFIIISVSTTLINTILKGNMFTDLSIRFLLLSCAVLVQYLLFRAPFRRLSNTLHSNWLPMALIPTAFCGLFLICGLYPELYIESNWSVLRIYTIALAAIAVYIVIFSSLLRSYHALEIQLKRDVMNAQLFVQKQYAELLLKLQNELNSLGSKITSESVYCCNPYVNSVLTVYGEQFKKLHIPFSFSIQLEDITLPDAEICLILNNALENAMEASLKLSEKNRFIQVQTKIVQEQFLIRICNNFNGKLTKSGDLLSSGKKEPGHGYGLSSIRAAAHRALGEMSFHETENQFTLDVRVWAKYSNSSTP